MKMQQSLDLQKLLSFLAKHGPSTQAEVEIGLKRPRRTLWGKLTSAVEDGYIRKDANERPHKYRVTGKGKRLLENAKRTKPMKPNRKTAMASDDELEKVILRVRKRERNSYHTTNETALINHVVHPILKALGWNHEKLEDVVPHYSIKGGSPRSASGNRKVDMALLYRGEPKIFIEAKNLQEELADWKTKLQECCRNAKTETPMQIGVLTNGFEWDLYLDEFSLGRNNFALAEKIVIDEGEPAKIAGKLKRFLYKPRVLNGTAEKAFKQALRETSRQARIKQNLDEALARVLKNADEWLQKALKKELLVLLGKPRLPSGYGNELSRFAKARAAKISHNLSTYSPDDKHPKVHKRNTAATQSNRSATTKQKPTYFYVFGTKMDFRTWREAAQSFLAEVYRQHPNSPKQLAEKLPNKFVRSATRPHEKNGKPLERWQKVYRLGNSNVWAYLNQNQTYIRSLCRDVCRVLQLSEDSIWFE